MSPSNMSTSVDKFPTDKSNVDKIGKVGNVETNQNG